MTKEEFIALGLTEDQATKAADASKKELEGYIDKQTHEVLKKENTNLKATVKENSTQLENLKKSAGDNAELQKQIETLQTENTKKDQDYQAQLKDLQISNAIKLSVSDKAQDADLVAGLIDKSKLILSDDGKVTGLDEQLKSLKENKAFLFKEDKTDNPNDPKPGFHVGTDGKGTEQQQSKPTNLFGAVAAHFQQSNLTK